MNFVAENVGNVQNGKVQLSKRLFRRNKCNVSMNKCLKLRPNLKKSKKNQISNVFMQFVKFLIHLLA